MTPPKNWLYFNSARRLWDGRLKSTHLQNHASLYDEFARQAQTPPRSDFSLLQENQQLTDLAEEVARKMLGPDWKDRQEQRRAASLNEKPAQQ